MLKINNLEVKVDNKGIINNLDLTIEDGEIHVLMGPNGVGKSTICKVLLKDDNYTIDSGEIIFDGNKLNDLSTTEVARLGIYLVNQKEIKKIVINGKKDFIDKLFSTEFYLENK